MRNRFLAKIVGAATAFAVTLGVGFAVSNTNRSVSPVEAATNGDYFKKVTNLSQLADGDEVIVTNSDGDYALSTTQNNNNRGRMSVSGTSGYFQYNSTIHASLQILTLKKWTISNNDYYGFHTGSGFLYSPSANNYLRTDTTSVDASVTAVQTYTWSLSVSDGVFTIMCAGRTSYYLQYNSGNSIFSCYKNTQANPSIYKKAHTVSYNSNGGTGTLVDSNSPYFSGTTVTVLSNTFVSAGMDFAKWNTAQNGGGLDYNPGDTFAISSNVVLYAQWASAGSDPYVTGVNESISGVYTGQTLDISFAYGNFSDTILLVSSDVNVFTISNVDTVDEGDSSATLNFKGSGPANLLFKDGASTIKTVSITVTQTTLSLNKDSTSICQGKSETLTATTNIGGATWTSSNTSAANVSNGIVTIPVDATVGATSTITATSDVDDSVSDACVITVLEAPLVYEIAFGTTKNTSASELDTDTFLSVYSVNSNVTCTDILKVYGTNNTNMLKMGSNSSASYIVLQIPSYQYFTKVEATISAGRDIDLEVQSGATDSTKEAQNVTDADTYLFDDYLEAEESNEITISTSDTGAIYLTALNLYYAIKTPVITSESSSINLITERIQEVEISVENFISTPTLECVVQSGDAYIDDVDVGAVNGSNKATALIAASDTAGEAVVRVRDSSNPTTYYVDITVNVVESAKQQIEALSTQSSLSYRFSKNELDQYAYSNVCVRFTGLINQDLWAQLDDESDVVGFGAMFAETDDLSSESLEDWYNMAKSGATIDEALDTLNDETDVSAYYTELTAQRTSPNANGDNYRWNLCVGVPEGKLTTNITGVVFVRTAYDGIIFLDEITVSVKSLATQLLANDPSLDTELNGSLSNLANL